MDVPDIFDRDPDAEPSWLARVRHHPSWAVRWWFVTVPVAVVAMLVLAVGAILLLDYQRASVPPAGDAAIASPTVLVDSQGEEIAQLDPAVVGEHVEVDNLPDHVIDAVLAAEDGSFWEHGGVSFSSTVRAALVNLRSGEVEQGASTITQQYVDLTTPGTGRSLRAKMYEAAAALKVEDELGKEAVLERYLNSVPFGRDTAGIDTAARVYFEVPAVDLDVNQAATLAGMIAAPSAFDPETNPEGATRRRNIVLDAMAEAGWLSTEEAERVRADELPEVTGERLVQYGDAAYVVDAVRRELEAELGPEGLGRGLVVETTISRRAQELAQTTLRDHVGGQPWTGAVVTIDPATGGVRALVGGADFAEQNFNAAIQAERQPGSSFKPFTLTAFVEEGFSPDTSRFPAPAELEVGTGANSTTVHNFGNRGFGELTVREATQNSVNTVYMQMVEEVTPEAVVDVADRLGIESDLPAVPSIALGTGSVTPFEMASAYATLAAEGVHRTPFIITRVERADGEVVYEADVDEHEAVDPQVAGVVTDVLADVVASGTGTAAQLEHPVAGKTGTTDDGRDAWFVGYTTQLATAVWIGNADNSPMGDATGGGLAAPLWGDYMGQVMAPLEILELPTASTDGLDPLDEVPDPEPTTAEPTPPERPPTEPEPTDTGTSETEPEPTETETAEPEPTTTETQTSPEPTETQTSPVPTETQTSPEPTETDTSGSGGTETETTETGAHG